MAVITTHWGGNPGAVVVDAVANPANPAQVYVLWSDGKISSKGNPPSLEGWRPSWEGTGQQRAKSIQILNWTTGRGFIMSIDGHIYSGAGAADVTGNGPNIGGMFWTDFSMNPDNSGQGWRLARNGEIYAFGGAPAPASPLFAFNPPLAKRMIVDWDTAPTIKYMVLHGDGNVHPRPSAGIVDVNDANNRDPYYPGNDMCRDFFAFDITGHWRGYILTKTGGIDEFWSVDEARPGDISTNQPFNFNTDRAVVLMPLEVNAGVVERAGMVTVDGTLYDWTVTPQDYSLVVSAPTGVQTTRKPTVQWTAALDGNGAPPDRAEVRIFRSDQYGAAGFTINQTPQYGSGVRNFNSGFGVLRSFVLDANLGNGTFKAYARVGKVLNDNVTVEWSQWDDGPAFSLAGVPPMPTNVTPINGASVNTDIPTVGMTLVAEAKGARLIGQWEIAQDSAFTNQVHGVLEPLTDLRLSGSTTEPVLTTQQLFQAPWFIRARAVSEFGDVSPWTATQSFTVSHPPGTANWSPTGNQARPYGVSGVVDLDWDFADSSPVDTESAYQVVVEVNDSAGQQVLDTGKVDSIVTAASVIIPIEFMNAELRWRVRVWDSDNVVGPFGQWNIFRVMELADVVITSPGDVVTTPQPIVTWTFAATAERIQAAFRVTITDSTEAVVFDSGQRQGNALSVQPDHPVLVNLETYTVSVTVWDSNNLQSTDTQITTASWVPPDAAASVVIDASNYEQLGYITITWDDSDPDPEFSEWRIYSRVPAESSTWVYVDSTSEGTYQDPRANTSVLLEYAVVQVAVRFDVEIESGYVPYEIQTTGTHYWLIYLEDHSLSVRLAQVTGDSYTDDYEEEVIELINRGRKVDKGTHFGVSGSLTGEVRDLDDGTTARQQKRKLETLQELRARLFLRTPFGDVWPVSAGNVQVGRISGMGTREFCNVTIPYKQVV